METLIVFGVLSLPIIALSWRALFNTKSHGFYRFFSWECIAWLLAANYRVWFSNPLSTAQVFSWILLLLSGYLVIAGIILLKKAGKTTGRDNSTLYQFEKTSELIDTGIYKYIRHPLYASLLCLTWGIYLKDASYSSSIAAILSTLFLYLTARYDEKECINYFGNKYSEYMKRSKMFIPFIL